MHMNIITINVGQGALAIVRHQKEAIIVDCRIPPSADDTVAYVKEMMALALKGHNVKGLILTGFDDDHSEIVGASIVLRSTAPTGSCTRNTTRTATRRGASSR